MAAIKSYLILGMCLLFLIQYFVQEDWLQLVLAIFAAVAFFGCIPMAKPAPRIFSILMLSAGVGFTAIEGKGIDSAAQGITSNFPLLTLLVLVPLLSIPFKMGGFFDSLKQFLGRYRNSPRKMFAGITAVIFLMSPILNVGSIKIVNELTQNLRLPPALLSKAYLMTYSTTILWSPYYAAVAVVLLYLHVSVGDYMSYGFGVAVLFLIVGNVMFRIWAKQPMLAPDERPDGKLMPEDRSKLKRLPFLLVSLMLTTMVTESLTHWSMLVLVSLLALVFPLLWGAFSRQWISLKHHLIDYRDQAVPMMNNEIIMYVSAGFFGQSLKGTSIGHEINIFMTQLSEVSFLLFALFILLTMICLTFVGIHQLVVVTILATQIDPTTLGTSKETLAMLFMLAWSTSSVLSPINPMNLLVSGLVNRTGIQVGVRDNGAYLLVVNIIGIALLTLIH